MSMNKYTYQYAKPMDVSDIKRIYDLNVNKLHGVIRTIEEWKNMIDNHYFVVRLDNVICGWYRVDKEEGKYFLGMLQVDPAFYRQGVGTYILYRFEDMAKNSFLSEVFVHTTEDNKEAISLYLKNGYEIISHEECQTADGVTRDGLTLKKTLSYK